MCKHVEFVWMCKWVGVCVAVSGYVCVSVWGCVCICMCEGVHICLSVQAWYIAGVCVYMCECVYAG